MTAKQRAARTIDMNAYRPEPEDTSAPPKGAVESPAQRAVEEIGRHTGVLRRFLAELELQQADEERYLKLQEQNAGLVQQISDTRVWLDMIKTALVSHDNGELSARQFANEVDAAIKGWEGR